MGENPDFRCYAIALFGISLVQPGVEAAALLYVLVALTITVNAARNR